LGQTTLPETEFDPLRAAWRPMNEADTCRKLVVPKLQAAGWEIEPHSIAEQRTITDGRIVPAGKGFIRRPPKRVDYLLRYTRDFPLAVIEAKASYRIASEGLQQAKDYAIMLGLKFAYATNGQEVIEFDFLTGLECTRADYPTPDDLWRRYRAKAGLSHPQADQLLTPFNHAVRMGERYYQQIAVNRVVEAILTGCNLDCKNPRAKEDIAHLPPEQIAASILEKEQRIAEIMQRIRKLLAGGADA
jgi:type I restriction enzyme R subunit